MGEMHGSEAVSEREREPARVHPPPLPPSR